MKIPVDLFAGIFYIQIIERNQERFDPMSIKYRDDFFFRKDIIWKAMSQLMNRCIKDPVQYQKKQVKKYGEFYSEVFAVAFQEQGPQKCMAVLEDDIDRIICVRYGWETMNEIRARELEKLKKDLGQ